MKLKRTLFIGCLLFAVTFLKAQNIEYGAILDTNYMLIGDQQYFTLKVQSDQGIKVIFPQFKDTITEGIEIISGPVRDSLKESNGQWLYSEKYMITAFDTGIYMIPSLPIMVEGDNYNNMLRTEPVGFVVNTFQVDEQKGNYDIVMPYDTPWSFSEILSFVLWGLLGLVVIAVGWWLVRRWRSNKPFFQQEKIIIPPYVKAIRSLDEIKASKLYQSEKVKEYYTRLTDTVRQYLDEECQIAAMEQTSDETIRALEDCRQVGSSDRNRMAEMLQVADFVKFAKSQPLQDENARYLEVAYEFLNNTNDRIRQEREEVEKKGEEEKKAEVDNENVK